MEIISFDLTVASFLNALPPAW